MIPDRNLNDPQTFLDILGELLGKRAYEAHLYLVEHNKPTVNRHSDEINIKIEDVVATPVRALKWDYQIGDEPIHEREFIIADSKSAEYLLKISKPSGNYIRLALYRFPFRAGETYSPQSLKQEDLTDRVDGVEKKLELGKNLPSGKIEVLETHIGDDDLSHDLLAEIDKISEQ